MEGNNDDVYNDVIAELRHSDPNVRKAALEALRISNNAAPHADTIAAMLQDADANVREAALHALGTAASPHADTIAAMHAETIAAMLQDADANVREAALHALGKEAAPHADTIAAMLQDPDANVRGEALEALNRIGAAAPHADTIGAMLHDADANVRRVALDTLGSIADTDTIVAMLQDANFSVRKVALRAVCRVGEAAAPHADIVVARLQDPEAVVRGEALKALNRIGAAPHADAIAAMLQDVNPDLRVQALKALGMIGEGAANADTIAAAILKALGMIEVAANDDTPAALGRSRPNADFQVAALEALFSIGKAAAPQADTMLQSCIPSVQLAAARVLSKLGCLKIGHHATLLQLQFELKARDQKREVGTIVRQTQAFCRSRRWTFREVNPHVSNLSQASLAVALDSLKQLGRHRDLSSSHVETVLARCADDVELDELILVLNNCQQTAAIWPHLQQLKDRTAISSTWVGTSQVPPHCTKAAQNLASSALMLIETKCLKWRTRTHVFAMIWKQGLMELPEGVVFLISNAMP